jgi:DNA-binding transcriptional ArsR family regulator
MVNSSALRLDSIFHALSDSTRRSILRDVAIREKTVSEIARPYSMSLAAVSKHLKVLEKSGLISRGRTAQFRPCHLEVELLDGAMNWIATYRRIWEERFDKLGEHLRAVGREPAPPSGPLDSPGNG